MTFNPGGNIERNDDQGTRTILDVEGFSPIAGRTGGRQGEVIQAPLHQAVGNDVSVKVPFSITDLSSWKLVAGNYRDDPIRAASAFEIMIKMQDPD